MVRGRKNAFAFFGGFLLVFASTRYFALKSKNAQLKLGIGNRQQQLNVARVHMDYIYTYIYTYTYINKGCNKGKGNR